MHVIILAAGQSKRFRAEGYNIPKPFLEIEWRGKTAPMIEHVINTVPREFINIIAAVPRGYNCSKGYFAIEDTKGPAETALRMLELIEPDSCLFLDADILNFTNDLYSLTRLHTCGVLVSESANPAFSYVDSLGYFSKIKEKERISNFAVRGAYFVAREVMSEFTLTLEGILVNQMEPYISQAFDLLKCSKFSVEATYIPVDWGTPRDIRLSGAHIMSDKGG